MVSIEKRSDYIKNHIENRNIKYFISWLNGEKLEKPNDLNLKNAEDLEIAALVYIQDNDKNNFEKCYKYLSNRKFKPHSPWINDDILIFSMICGVKKFSMSTDILLEIIDIRLKSNDEENKQVAQTYKDIIYDNLNSRTNIYYLIIIYIRLMDLSEYNEELINKSYLYSVRKGFPLYKSHFLNIMVLVSLDIIVLLKGLSDPLTLAKYNNFIDAFKKRTNLLSNILFYSALVLVICVLGGLFIHYLNLSEAQKEIMDKILTAISFLIGGGVFSALFKYKKVILGLLNKMIYGFWGYK